ncbi:hypothetical protein [Bradyrhizobium icense]|uniref:hypothetical protein n=1 Tax=Bradyrhizobium icense TaxID=1274631 RepID=UPI0012EA1980|nr:hypothetical protein [Bradyrhizobium icense]
MSTVDPMAVAIDWLDAYRAASLSIVDLYASDAALEMRLRRYEDGLWAGRYRWILASTFFRDARQRVGRFAADRKRDNYFLRRPRWAGAGNTVF